MGNLFFIINLRLLKVEKQPSGSGEQWVLLQGLSFLAVGNIYILEGMTQ